MLMLLCVHVTSVLFFSTVHPDYGLRLELHVLTLIARSYALLIYIYIYIGYNDINDECNTVPNYMFWTSQA